MAFPLLALGKIVSGVVTGTAKGLAVAGKATVKGSKVVGRAAGKAARAGGELAIDTASAAKKGFIKGVRATTKGLQKAASATKKSMSNFSKRMSKRKTSGGIEKLKKNSEKIRNNINRDIKKLKKQRLDRERIQRNVLERKEIRNMEKNINSPKTPTGKKVQSVLKSPMIIIDKIFGLGGILLTGIIVNSIEAIIKKWKEFKENTKPIFDFLGKIINGIGNFLGDVKISKLEKEGLKMDELAVFNPEGDLIDGKLLAVKKTVEGLGEMIKTIKSTIPIKTDEQIKDESAGYLEQYGFDDKKFEQKVKRGQNQWWDFMDIIPNPIESIELIPIEKESKDKKNNEIKKLSIYKDSVNNNIESNFLSSLNTNSSNTTIILAMQKYKEYIPISGRRSGFSEEPSNYTQFPKISSIWTT